MSRNEIRLRRQRTPGPAASRFRNYSDVLHRHEKAMRVKEITRILIVFIIIMTVIAYLVFLKLEKPKKPAQPKPTRSAMYAPGSPSKL